jgi:replicative DNA helicase
MMCDNAFSALKQGHNVMYVTFELSTLKTAMRIAANMAETPTANFTATNIDDMEDVDVSKLRDMQSKVRRIVKKQYRGAELVIYDLPPDECSVDNVYSIIDTNRKMKGWVPKIVILDYLELMVSRRASMNDSDYTRQKSVATEVRGLARNENVLLISATQTNRSGASDRGGDRGDQEAGMRGGSMIGLDKSAESFGKTMPVDYVVSLNQTMEQYNRPHPVIDLFIAKNRNGEKFKRVTTTVNYNRMTIKEIA